MSYNPEPPRVWSRVQNRCTFINSGDTYTEAFIPLTGQTVSQAQSDYEDKLLYKGNILQYKGNSARLTKTQKYSQLARSGGPNRKKVFATQSQTYSNPNTTGLQRVNSIIIPFPNEIVGAPNNISGPYQYGIPNPNGCSGTSLVDGGTLICGTLANPCTGEIIKPASTTATICNPASASDVPGSSILCWNNKVQTWFPKPRYVMNNSTSKWPVNYKGFVSAVKPEPPYLMITQNTCNSVTLTWVNVNNNCIPISSYNIYQNDILIETVLYNINTATISNLLVETTYSFYVTSVSNTIESLPSNTILYNNILPFTATGTFSYTVDSNCNYIVIFSGNGTIIFNNVEQVTYTVTGGGGNGGDGPTGGGTNAASGGGGGGGGGTNIGNFIPVLSSTYIITVGISTQTSIISTVITSNPGSNGGNGSSVTPNTGGSGGSGGSGTNPGNIGSNGGIASTITGGLGGSGGFGYGGYGLGGVGGQGGDINGGAGQSGNNGTRGVVILSFNT